MDFRYIRVVMTLRKRIYRALKPLALRLCHSKVVEWEWLKWKGYPIDWKNPRDINEKIQWLMCFSDTSEWSRCADKVLVRDFVRERGLGDLLPETLGVWERAGDIDFGVLPDKFVLKCNHDSGSCVIIDKNEGYDEKAVREDLDRHLKVRYGTAHGEMYYDRIKPLILAEEYLDGGDTSVVDYKYWCFDGKPYSIFCCHDRSKDGVVYEMYDLDWNFIPGAVIPTAHSKSGDGRVPMPRDLKKMEEAAAVLSKGFPEVRVDFYDVGGKVYFGEMSFSCLCGKIDFYSDEYLKELGKRCVIK